MCMVCDDDAGEVVPGKGIDELGINVSGFVTNLIDDEQEIEVV